MRCPRIYCALVAVTLLLLSLSPPAYGGRGGGGRGGGSRGGSRGSSGRGSSSRGSNRDSHRQTQYERRNKESSQKSETTNVRTPERKPSVPESKPKPSAPELPASGVRPVQPSAPELPRQPSHNPGYPPQGPPPPYPGGSRGADLGKPPPYSPPNQPPPYPGPQQRPPPYDFGKPASNPSAPYPRQPGSAPYPQQPGMGNAPYPQQAGGVNSPYPRQPGMGNAPYPQQAGGVNSPYPRQPGMGNAPYPQQAGGVNSPYPRQPGTGINPYYRQPGMPSPSYAQHSGLPMGGNMYAKPYKKKGLLGQIFSGGTMGHKANKHGMGGAGAMGMGMGGAAMGIGAMGMGRGKHFGMGSRMSPAMFLLPLAMMSAPSLLGHAFRPPMYFMPYHHHHYGYGHDYRSNGRYYDIEDTEYRGKCRRPFTPDHSTMQCDATSTGAKCTIRCNEGYQFSDNTTLKENECWHVAGAWKPQRNFQACQPICPITCENGGKCSEPGKCACHAEYRGDRCEHHVWECDVRKLAGAKSSKLGWSCHHGRNETLCKIRCRSPMQFASYLVDFRDYVDYHCTPQGVWTPDTLPECKHESELSLTTVDVPESTKPTP